MRCWRRPAKTSAAEPKLTTGTEKKPAADYADKRRCKSIRHFVFDPRSSAQIRGFVLPELNQVSFFHFQILVDQGGGKAAGGDLQRQRALIADLAGERFSAM